MGKNSPLYLNKNRVEALSDGVFAIVMTLLIIEIKVPISHGEVMTNDHLWHELTKLWPLFCGYVISFLILGMFWNAHHGFFHIITKEVGRAVSLVNIFFLMLIATIPFSAHLLGEYPTHEPAIIIYGINIILIGSVLYLMFRLVIADDKKRHEHVSKRLITQAAIRILIVPVFAFFGVMVSFINITLSYFFFIFPIIFNIIPGSLNVIEGGVKQVGKILDT